MELRAEGSLEPGTVVSLRPKQGQLVDKLQAAAAFQGSVVVDNCLACTSPVAKIKGPQVSLVADAGCISVNRVCQQQMAPATSKYCIQT